MSDREPTEHDLRAMWNRMHSGERGDIASHLIGGWPLPFQPLAADAWAFLLAFDKASRTVQSSLYWDIHCDLPSE